MFVLKKWFVIGHVRFLQKFSFHASDRVSTCTNLATQVFIACTINGKLCGTSLYQNIMLVKQVVCPVVKMCNNFIRKHISPHITPCNF